MYAGAGYICGCLRAIERENRPASAVQQTIQNQPERFLAYNNGISATASSIELERLPEGGLGIRSLHDLQIVNGGQTTASIYYYVRKSKKDVSRLRVQAKISVVGEKGKQEMVPLISRYANSQNKVSEADFNANDPFHVQLETFSRSIWAPAAEGTQRQTRWFYERARGQYQDALAHEGTLASQRRFKESHPLAQKFTKTDLAKYEMTWQQCPHVVSTGAQKCFIYFSNSLAKRGHFEADKTYFYHLIAKAILFKRAETIVGSLNFGGYRANIVTYTLAYLCHHTAGRIDLDRIWQRQDIGQGLVAAPREQERTPAPQPLETPRDLAGAGEMFPTPTQSTPQPLSRRAVVVLASAITASAALGGGLTWLFLSHAHGPQPSLKSASPVPSASVSTPSSTQATTAELSPTSVATSSPVRPMGTTLNVYRGHTLYIYGVTWASPDGQRIASASDDRSVQDWGTYTNQTYFSYRQHGPVNDVKASHDRPRLASVGDDHTVQLRDARTGVLLFTYTGHTGAVYTAEWSPDDRYLATSSADHTVRVWEADSGKTITIYRQHAGIVWAAGWSPDGKSIVSGSADNTAQVWDATSGAILQVYTGHTATVRSVSWSERQYGVATASEDLTVRVWNPSTGATQTIYRGHTALLRTVAWSHSSAHIVSGARDATAQIWDGFSGQHLYTYRGHSSTVFDAQWSADDTLIVSGSTDATAQIWQAS